MEFRIPLSLVLNFPTSRRHKIPHRTLFLDAVHPFVQYLCSDDTRLPWHSELTAVARPAGDYETYVGEDIWLKEVGTGSDDTVCELRFDDIVQWVINTLNELNAAGNGVVLCGERVVADDCGWAVVSRTPTLNSPRDVFVAMRNSSKFLHDVHHQLHAADLAGGSLQVRITLAQALGGDPAKEFRVFVPYRLYTSEGDACIEEWDGQMYTGISQRATDVCFPALVGWDASTHEKNYNALLSYVKNARLLEKAFEIDSQLRTALFRRANILSSCCFQSANKRLCVVLFAVDVLFESISLPFYVLSAAVQCFRHDDENDAVCAVPLVLENDARVEEENIVGENGEIVERNSGEWDMLRDSASFFRLFRDVFNWNLHVEAWRRDSSKESDVCGFQKGRRFFVIASDHSDLVTTKDSIAKRGVPLELMQPELLLCNDVVTEEWRDKFKQFLSAVGKSL